MNCPHCGQHVIDEAAFCPWCDSRIPDGPVYEDYVYEAFISYRHLPHDHKVAVRLQRSIEGFRIPKALRKDPDKKRLGKLFRDEDELPIASSLPDQIDEALRRSSTLIVISSPQMRESQWVRREVEQFASYHGRQRIRIALIEGEPDESFPELLMTKPTSATSRASTSTPSACASWHPSSVVATTTCAIACALDDSVSRWRRQRLCR